MIDFFQCKICHYDMSYHVMSCHSDMIGGITVISLPGISRLLLPSAALNL